MTGILQAQTIGGPFTNMVAYFPPMIFTAGDGHGGASCSGWVGSGSAVEVDTQYRDNGSSQWLAAPSSKAVNFSQGRKFDYWTGPVTDAYIFHDYTLASCQPIVGNENLNVQDSPTPSFPPFDDVIDFQAFFDNQFASGQSGASKDAVRNSLSWVTVSSQPGSPTAQARSVKCYSANQIQFGPDTDGRPAGVPLREFSQIRGRAWAVNPRLPVNEYQRIIYEQAFDIYQHFDNGGTVEVMFWTQNHLQAQSSIGPFVETVDFGDGKLWDLYVSTETLASGGAGDDHPYGIYYLQEQFQSGDAGWVDILAGLRYFNTNYVVSPDTPNPLDLPVWQVTHGWEIINTNFGPVPFRMLDYRLEIS